MPPPPAGSEKDLKKPEALNKVSDTLGITVLDEPGKQSDPTGSQVTRYILTL